MPLFTNPELHGITQTSTISSLQSMRLERDNSDEEAIEATIRYFSEAKFAQLNDQDAQRYNFTEFFVPDYQQNTNLDLHRRSF